MYNLMIIDQDPHQIAEIVNYIGEKCHDIRISYISYDSKQILDTLKKCTTDIILLVLSSYDASNIHLITYIQEQNMYQYKKSIIIKADTVNDFPNFKNNKYVFTCIKEISSIPQAIKNLITYKTNVSDIKNEIKKELINLDYNYSYNGTKYLEETILEIYKVKFEFDGNLSKNIYSVIARRHKKNTDTIYGNIKQATNAMITKCDKRKLRDYLGYNDYYIKPKIQEIIFTILNKIDK